MELKYSPQDIFLLANHYDQFLQLFHLRNFLNILRRWNLCQRLSADIWKRWFDNNNNNNNNNKKWNSYTDIALQFCFNFYGFKMKKFYSTRQCTYFTIQFLHYNPTNYKVHCKPKLSYNNIMTMYVCKKRRAHTHNTLYVHVTTQCVTMTTA